VCEQTPLIRGLNNRTFLYFWFSNFAFEAIQKIILIKNIDLIEKLFDGSKEMQLMLLLRYSFE
jgi:hypothetical protein